MRVVFGKLAFAGLFLFLLSLQPLYPQGGQTQTLDLGFYTPPTENTKLPLTNKSKAKNVILMIGDGMGQAQIDAARIKALGAGGFLHMERLPVTGLVHTHALNRLITDSSAAGTALATGFKTNNQMVSQLPDGTRLPTILEAARDAGLATGLAVTSAINHATPATFAAHNVYRYNYDELAEQLLESRIDVMLGGGRQWFLPKSAVGSMRKDDLDLVARAKAAGYDYAPTKEELRLATAERVLGLFQSDGLTGEESEPTLAEMTAKAIELLRRNKKGFFLMVEGSQIDWANEDNKTTESIHHMLHFDLAVKVALDFALEDNKTLVIVTSDHESGGMSIVRGSLDGARLTVRWTTNTHTPLTVPLFAFGPAASSFTGVRDNTELPRLMARALRLKDFLRALERDRK